MLMPLIVPEVMLGVALMLFFVTIKVAAQSAHSDDRSCGLQSSGRHGDRPRAIAKARPSSSTRRRMILARRRGRRFGV